MKHRSNAVLMLTGLFAAAPADLPAFCRVVAVVRPATDSEIGFELWLPLSNWNRKFMGVGNGGFAGDIDYVNMSSPVSRGYATVSTDTGYRRVGAETMVRAESSAEAGRFRLQRRS